MCVHIFIQTFASRSRHLQTKVDGAYTFIYSSLYILYIYIHIHIYIYTYIYTGICATAPSLAYQGRCSSSEDVDSADEDVPLHTGGRRGISMQEEGAEDALPAGEVRVCVCVCVCATESACACMCVSMCE